MSSILITQSRCRWSCHGSSASLSRTHAHFSRMSRTWGAASRPVVVGPRHLEILPLDLAPAQLPPPFEPHLPPAGDIVGDLLDGPDRVLEGKILPEPPILHHDEDDRRRADLQKCGA